MERGGGEEEGVTQSSESFSGNFISPAGLCRLQREEDPLYVIVGVRSVTWQLCIHTKLWETPK